MNKRQWKKIYKQTLIQVSGIDKKFAEECYQAGLENHDYDDDPADSANMEMSYWTD